MITQPPKRLRNPPKRTWFEEFECDETLHKFWRERDYAVAFEALRAVRRRECSVLEMNALLWMSHLRIVNWYVKCEKHMMAKVDAKRRSLG